MSNELNEEYILGSSEAGQPFKIKDVRRIKSIHFTSVEIDCVKHCSEDVFLYILKTQHAITQVNLEYLIQLLPTENKTDAFWAKTIAINPLVFCALPVKTHEWFEFTLESVDKLYADKPIYVHSNRPLSLYDLLVCIYASILNPDEKSFILCSKEKLI